MQFIRSAGGSIALVLLIAFCWQFYTYVPLGSLGYDESIYRFYVQTLEQNGVEGIRAIIHAWPTDEKLSKGPLPFRYFYILLGSWTDKLLGGNTSVNLANMSLVFNIGTILISLLLFRRWFGATVGLLAAILMVFSPLATDLSHRALQDTCTAFLIISSIFFYDRYWVGGKYHDLLLFSAALLAGLMTKESMLFLYPPFLLAACYYAQSIGWRSRIPLLLPLVLAPSLSFTFICWLSGDLQTCLTTYQAYFSMQHKIPYALKFQAGPWFRYLVDFMLLSPTSLVLAIIGIASLSKNFDGTKRKYIAHIYLLSGLLVFSLLPLMNVRLVLFLDVFIRLFAVLGAITLCQQIPFGRYTSACIGLLMSLIIASDIIQFHTIFEISKVYDPVTEELIEGNGLVREID